MLGAISLFCCLDDKQLIKRFQFFVSFGANLMAKIWRRGVVVITTAQLPSTKPEFRFCASSNPAHGVSEICDGENL